MAGSVQEAELLVIGGGPGGYAAAFRAADLGVEVTLVEAEPRLGGECLFRGCIPSKTLLTLSELIHDAKRAAGMGLTFGEPRMDLAALRAWKDQVIDKLADGLMRLARMRKVRLIQARATFEGAGSVRLQGQEELRLRFRHAVVAAGSHPSPFPGLEFREGGRIMDSSAALSLAEIPETLLVVGGGYVALELGQVYAALGSRVTLVVRGDRLMRRADSDLVMPLQRRLHETFEAIHLNARVKALREDDEGVEVALEGDLDRPQTRFDRVLMALGRSPNTLGLGLEAAGVRLNEQSCVVVDAQRRTANPRVFAIGDLVPGPMLAHTAMREGKVAAEVVAGQPSAYDVQAVPAVVYTDPQLAWCGLTEEDAQRQGKQVKVSRFPWKFSGRATTMGAPEGLTKMLIDPASERILGVGIVGRHAEGLISEATLAIEMGALATDVALTIHPHPTLSETEAETAELFLGSATHILPK